MKIFKETYTKEYIEARIAAIENAGWEHETDEADELEELYDMLEEMLEIARLNG